MTDGWNESHRVPKRIDDRSVSCVRDDFNLGDAGMFDARLAVLDVALAADLVTVLFHGEFSHTYILSAKEWDVNMQGNGVTHFDRPG